MEHFVRSHCQNNFTNYQIGKEVTPMKCHVCGTPMRRVVTDLPFRVNRSVMIILRNLPLLECGNCSAYALEDKVMERVHEIIERLRSPSHLEAVLFSASPVSYTKRAA